MTVLFLLSILNVSETFAETDDYQKRLENLKVNQLKTQSIINQLSGFESNSNLNFNGLDESKKNNAPLFKLHNDLTSNRIKTGNVYRGISQNRIIVGGEGSPSIIQFNQNQGNLSGLKCLGLAKASSTDGRIHFDVTRLITHSGKVVPIKAVVLDQAGSIDVEAQVFSSKALAVAGSLASSFIAGVAANKQTGNTNAFGFYQNQPSGKNAILGGIAQTAADQSKRLIEESTTEKPILVLDEGTPVNIYFDEEVKF